MSKGRKRTPVEQKKVMGTFRQDRVVENFVEAIPGTPIMPAEDGPEVQRWFEKVLGYLQGENRGSKSDELVMHLAARRLTEIQELDKLVNQPGGRVYMADNGLLKANPAVAQLNEAMRHLQSLLAELGLTPASRSRVSADVKKAKAQDEWDFLAEPVAEEPDSAVIRVAN